MFYGDTTRWFLGTVANTKTKDPHKQGRIQIRIYSCFLGWFSIFLFKWGTKAEESKPPKFSCLEVFSAVTKS